MFSQATAKAGLDAWVREGWNLRCKAYTSPAYLPLHQDPGKSSAHFRLKHLKIVLWEDYGAHHIMTTAMSAAGPQWYDYSSHDKWIQLKGVSYWHPMDLGCYTPCVITLLMDSGEWKGKRPRCIFNSFASSLDEPNISEFITLTLYSNNQNLNCDKNCPCLV